MRGICLCYVFLCYYTSDCATSPPTSAVARFVPGWHCKGSGHCVVQAAVPDWITGECKQMHAMWTLAVCSKEWVQITLASPYCLSPPSPPTSALPLLTPIHPFLSFPFSLPSPVSPATGLCAHLKMIDSFDVCPSGRYTAAVSQQGNLLLYDLHQLSSELGQVR